jgi:hypothetical protein
MSRRINRHSDDSINLTSEPLSQIILPALRAEKNQSAPRESESICRLRSMEILTPNIRSQRELHEQNFSSQPHNKRIGIRF